MERKNSRSAVVPVTIDEIRKGDRVMLRTRFHHAIDVFIIRN